MKKKIFFIHVAKTAGSSFNTFLKQHFQGEEHCERYLDKDNLSFNELDYLKTLDYISGHLRLDVFYQNKFSQSDYFLITFLRNPISQLLSHVNWVIHIYDISPKFFANHPKHIQEISLELRAANLYDTDTFIAKLQKFPGLFKNNQSRYFLRGQDKLSSKNIIQQLLTLDLVGLTEYFAESLDYFAYLNEVQITPQNYRVNSNPQYRVGKDILENTDIFDFLQNYNKVDLDVYNHFWEYSREVLNLQKTSTEVLKT